MGDESETILKTFARTDAEQNQFGNVYTGRDQLSAWLGLTYNAVMKLMSPRYLLRHRNYDNFYTSLPLVRVLCDADT